MIFLAKFNDPFLSFSFSIKEFLTITFMYSASWDYIISNSQLIWNCQWGRQKGRHYARSLYVLSYVFLTKLNETYMCFRENWSLEVQVIWAYSQLASSNGTKKWYSVYGSPVLILFPTHILPPTGGVYMCSCPGPESPGYRYPTDPR